MCSGYLRFANVEAGDGRDGSLYSCMVYNPKLRGFVQGDDQTLAPRPAPAGRVLLTKRFLADFLRYRLFSLTRWQHCFAAAFVDFNVFLFVAFATSFANKLLHFQADAYISQ